MPWKKRNRAYRIDVGAFSRIRNPMERIPIGSYEKEIL
jgi:hypothetical protein